MSGGAATPAIEHVVECVRAAFDQVVVFGIDLWRIEIYRLQSVSRPAIYQPSIWMYSFLAQEFMFG